MTSENEMLPLPKGSCASGMCWDAEVYTANQMHAYARANMEALRAEVAEWKRVAAAQAELHGEAEVRVRELAKALAELITWIPSADTYRRLGFDPAAPMRTLERAKLSLGRGGLSND